MENLLKNKIFYLLFFISIISYSGFSQNKLPIEKDILNALKSNFSKSIITVKANYDQSNPKDMVSLAIKIENIINLFLPIDIMTISYQKPVLNLERIKKGFFYVTKHSGQKVSALISPKSIEQYIQNKANYLNKKNVDVKVKYSPPFVECFYNVPLNQISQETTSQLTDFTSSGKFEGYAAFTFKVRNNDLSARGEKVILNHFLLPKPILRLFEDRNNPFDEIIEFEPLKYKFNSATVQKNYILLTN